MPAAKRKRGHAPHPDDEHEVISLSDGAENNTTDEDDDVRATPDPPAPQPSSSRSRVQPKAAKGKAPSATIPDKDDVPPLPTSRPTASARENERLRKLLRATQEKLEDYETRQNELQRSFDDYTKLRTTDAERSREDQRVEFEARIQSQEKLIAELTAQLARITKASGTKAPVASKAGHSGVPHFITREIAQDERRAIEREVAKRDDELRASNARIKEQEARIDELSQSLRLAEEELRLERQSHVARTPTHRARSEVDEHQTRVIRFYEDSTNLLVTNIKAGSSAEGTWTYNCMFAPEGGHSLNFTLGIFPASNPQGSETYVYTPLGLSNEKPALLNRLDYFTDSFQFPKAQLSAFFRQLGDQLTNDDDNDGE